MGARPPLGNTSRRSEGAARTRRGGGTSRCPARSRRGPSRRGKGLEGARVGARGALRVDRLDADVRGTRIAMRADAAREGFRVAPGDERVDQPIAPAVREIGFPEAEAAHALLVVRERQVEGAGLTGHAPRFRRLALEEDFLLDAEPRLGPEGLARPRGVLGRYQVRVRAERTPGGKAEELRAKSGEHGGGRGLWLRGAVDDPLHPVEVRLERRNGTPILTAEHVLDERRVGDAEPEDEAPLRLLGECALCRGRSVGFAQEDVRDACRDVEALSCREEPARLYEGVSALDLREPEDSIAEGFHLPSKPGGLPRCHRVRADPDTGPADRICAGWSARVRNLRVRHRCSFSAVLIRLWLAEPESGRSCSPRRAAAGSPWRCSSRERYEPSA